MTIKFSDLKLGYASAEEEGSSSPVLLLDGYLDIGDMTKEARLGTKYLWLGYKGSGKSAFGEHLRLTSQAYSHEFTEVCRLGDFPYKNFKSIIRGTAEPESRFPSAWSWLLLIKLFNSFSKDVGSPTNKESEFIRTLDTLRHAGLILSDSLRDLTLVTSKINFKIPLFGIGEAGGERTSEDKELDVEFFVPQMKAIAATFKSESRHLLVIDGLDDILSKRDVQYDSLAALVFEVGQLNAHFRNNNTPAKIILLCRTDLFERLPGPNKNKIRMDSSVILDWFNDPRNPEKSKLIELVNRKVGVTHPSIGNIFHSFFPKTIAQRDKDRGEGQPIRSFLLDFTRHTPRDFIQVLTAIQRHAVGHEGPLTRDQILEGVRDYSINYFLPEIKDEMVGYIDSHTFELMQGLISSLGKREFTLQELSERASKHAKYSKLDFEEIINRLFECSAIGNIYYNSRGETHYTFKYRNRHSALNNEHSLILHKGIWKALNLGR